MQNLRLDPWLVIPSLFLSFLSLLILKSVAPDVFNDQIVFLIISCLFFILFSRLDYQIISALYLPAYGLSLIFLLLPSVFGLVTRGATRWIPLGNYTLQPSELVKPVLLIAFAAMSVSKLKNSFFYLFLLAAVPVGIIFLQPDLGTSLIILAGWLPILFSRSNVKTLVLLSFVAIASIFPTYKFLLHDYQRDRLITFVNPYRDPLDKGYHVIQSTIAVGSGGIWGRGLGHGTQSQLRFLPEHHTDFIFAALSEELGFVGTSLVIFLYLVLIWRIYKISQTVQNPAAAVFCLGAASMLTFQIFINIGMNMGIAPVTGITLPLLSYGGSSMISVGILLGLINSLSSRTHVQSSIRIR